jgi:hypothetical protein
MQRFNEVCGHNAKADEVSVVGWLVDADGKEAGYTRITGSVAGVADEAALAGSATDFGTERDRIRPIIRAGERHIVEVDDDAADVVATRRRRLMEEVDGGGAENKQQKARGADEKNKKEMTKRNCRQRGSNTRP